MSYNLPEVLAIAHVAIVVAPLIVPIGLAFHVMRRKGYITNVRQQAALTGVFVIAKQAVWLFWGIALSNPATAFRIDNALGDLSSLLPFMLIIALKVLTVDYAWFWVLALQNGVLRHRARRI